MVLFFEGVVSFLWFNFRKKTHTIWNSTYKKINKSFLNDIAKTFRDLVGVKANLLIKDEKAKIYIKAREDILNILELLGAKEAVSELYKLIGVRNIRGNVTRTVNLISANAEKNCKKFLETDQRYTDNR